MSKIVFKFFPSYFCLKNLFRYFIGFFLYSLYQPLFQVSHSIFVSPHVQDILWKCCDYLEELRPDTPADTRRILLLLHTLVAFTATNTWVLLRAPSMAPLRAGMAQLCANIMGHLFMRGFYITLKVRGVLVECCCV